MINLRLLAGIATAIVVFTACEDTTDTLGNSLTNDVDRFKIVTDTFQVTSKSIKIDSVLATGQYSYLGRMKDPETGAYVTSNYTTQFHVLEDLGVNMFPPIDSIASLNADKNVFADSCVMRIYFYSSVGDTLNPMQMTIKELSKPIEEGVKYYSNFDPEKKGLVRTDGKGVRKVKMYTAVDQNLSDSTRSTIINGTNMQYVVIPLNDKYVNNGVEYENYGSFIMRKFYENPKNFKNSYNFIHNVCPGFYIKSTDGVGLMSQVYTTELITYYRYLSNNSPVTGVSLMTGTEEVMQTTYVSNDNDMMQQLVDDNSCTYLKTPAGIFTEVTLPIDDIKNGHLNDTISSAKIVFTRYNLKDKNSEITEPTSLLMLPKDSLYSFFEHKNLPDNKTSYIASYSSSLNTYTYSNISGLITQMYETKANGSPDWNKVVLVPVNITYNTSSSSSSITNISNQMTLSSTRLVGGSGNTHAPIKISVIYNKFRDK